MELTEQKRKFIRALPPQQRLAVFDQYVKRRVRAVGASSFVPNNLAQEMAWTSEADIVYFGGRAGAGKTYMIAAKAVYRHRRSLLIRKEFKEHKGSEGLFEQVEKLSRVHPNMTDGIFKLENGIISLGGTDRIGKFFGKPHDLIAVDELAEIPKTFFQTIIAWNRTTEKGQRCQVFCAGNPPLNPDGEWVIDYFAPWLDPKHERPAVPGELRWFANIDGKEIEVKDSKPVKDSKGMMIHPRSRTFIPGEMVSYLKETGYDINLQNLPEPARSKLLFGDFSIKLEDDAFQVIPRAHVRAAIDRWKVTPKPTIPMTQLGVDVARGGEDRTVITAGYGNWYDEQDVYSGRESVDGQRVFGFIVLAAGDDDPIVNIDYIGVGSSPYDFCKEKFKTAAVNAGAKSEAKDKSGKYRLINKRAEHYWKLREDLDPRSGKNLCIPPDKELENELCAAKFEFRSDGIKIEDKDEIKKRIGRSPDKADSLVLAHAKEYSAAAAVFGNRRDDDYNQLRES